MSQNMRSSLPCGEDVSDKVRIPSSGSAMDDVSQPTEAWNALHTRWAMITALLEGTDAFRKAGHAYLPQEPAESSRAYQHRLKRSVLFGAFKKTVTTSTGRPFSRPIMLEGFSATLERLCDNIDLQGNNLNVFARHVFMSGLAYGHSFILVDHPKRPGEEIPSLAEERDLKLRPYWRAVDPIDVIGWRSENVGGTEVPTQVRIRETATKAVGRFGETSVRRVRVLEPGRFTLYEEDRAGKWGVIEEGVFLKANGDTMDRIPLVPFYSTLPKDFYYTSPTLLDLAFMNVLHWQSSSDQDNILHVARVPILFGSGFFDDDDLEIGASRWVKGPEGSALSYVEHSGAAIESGRVSLEDLENRMRIMGAEILVRDPARITATQKILDSDEATSELQDMVIRFEDFLYQCFAITAEWLGEDQDVSVGTIGIYKDFGISANAFNESNILLQSRLAKQITQDTYLTELKRRGMLGDDVDIAAEVVLTEGEASRAAQGAFYDTEGAI